MFGSKLDDDERIPLLSNGRDKRSPNSNEFHSNIITHQNEKTANELPKIGGTLYLPHKRRYKYPLAVIFVLVAKFFEAFAANGIRTILALYLRDDLSFSESLSTVMLHIFNFFGQFCPIFGAIVADNFIGNIRAITYFCLIYATGWTGLILTSFPLTGIPIVFLVSLSLLLLAIGNGSIRACITSLGATQFKLPEQQKSFGNYFSHYYFVYYVGMFLSKIIPPLIRAETTCFQKEDCYPAVFGTLGSAFLGSWTIFLIGKYFYKNENILENNIMVKFYKCVKYALAAKLRRREKSVKYWLHYSLEKYPEEFVNDVGKFLKVAKLFLPLPIYYALLAQQDSTWTFQATQMNTTVLGITIEPDQAKAMGPIFLFTMIPLWQYIFVPILSYCNVSIHPLHSVIIGGICSGLSFICAGCLQLNLEGPVPKNITILWQIPQFVLLMMGELFLSIPGLQFAFTEAPSSMKSVLTAAWFLNNAFGNLIVVLLTEFKLTNVQSSMYFIYAGLMFFCITIFTGMTLKYLKESKQNESDIRVTTTC